MTTSTGSATHLMHKVVCDTCQTCRLRLVSQRGRTQGIGEGTMRGESLADIGGSLTGTGGSEIVSLTVKSKRMSRRTRRRLGLATWPRLPYRG